MKSLTAKILAMLLALSTIVFAQGSESTEPSSQPSESALKVTRSLTGTVKVVKAKENTLVIEATGKAHALKVTPQTKIQSVANPAGNRKEIVLQNLKPGQKVKVLYHPSDNTAVDVQERE